MAPFLRRKKPPGPTTDGSSSRGSGRVRMLASPSRDAVPRGLAGRARYYTGKLPSLPSLSGGRWAMLGVMAAACVGLGFLFQAFLLESDYFEVRDWAVENNERLTPEEVTRLARGGDVDWPVNLFAFEPGEAEDLLRTHPVIRNASVLREPPNTVRLIVQERKERAVMLDSGGRGLLVDVEGVLFAEARTAELLDKRLPVLTMGGGQTWNVGDRLPPDFMRLVMEYKGTLLASVSPLVTQVSEYHWSEEQGLVLVMRSGARLVCGRLGPEATLYKAEGLMGKYPKLAGIMTADLRIDSHIPWLPEPTPTPVPKRR